MQLAVDNNNNDNNHVFSPTEFPSFLGIPTALLCLWRDLAT